MNIKKNEILYVSREMFGKHSDVNSFAMLAIDQEVFYIKVQVSKRILSVRVLDIPKAIEPRNFLSMGSHG